MISIPISDHCEPLVERPEDLEDLLHSLELDCKEERWRYVEIRPRTAYVVPPSGLAPAQAFYFHALDLRPELTEIFHRFQKEPTKIRRAQREGLTRVEGRSAIVLDAFYQLLVRTRRRLQLPPQPRDWFRNLVDCLGDRVTIRVAAKNERPIAGILTLSFKDVLVYKYGCSDESFHNLGGIPLLLWNAIQEAKRKGAREFDMGRSDADNAGLIAFKEHWGATRSRLTYWRYPTRPAWAATTGGRRQAAKRIVPHLPDRVLIAAAKMLYKHLGSL